MSLSRRSLLSASAVGLAFTGLARLAQAQTPPPKLDAAQIQADPYLSEVTAYGPLKADPAGVFDLPEGFSYTVVSSATDAMSDGLVTPHKFDGMACFGLDGDRVILTRNHELKLTDLDLGRGAFGTGQALANKTDAARVYDRTPQGLLLPGGVTRVTYDLKARRIVDQHLALAGTMVNCAGGPTPWGSWLSCEETLQGAGDKTGKSHGWVFEVPAGAQGLVDPVPLTGLGRFKHEAAAVDPRTGVVYLTEDQADGLFYRFLPNDRRDLAKGGRLQALGFKDEPSGDSRNWSGATWTQGQRRETIWIDLDGTDNPNEDLALRGHAAGAAWFARGEGLFHGGGEIFFTCTSGGPQRLGQIMRYRPSPHEGQGGEKDHPGRLQLFVEPRDRQVMNMCDNIAVSPWGHLVVCEDKVGGVNYLKAVTPKGKIYTLGRNARPGAGDVGVNSELAGVCFSPDGTTMFVNVYFPGVTLAITGPWGRFKG
ncbi:secreted PhoX family phosphatase [Caulobacter ginsengisoli]|uniref:Secreted PhoX family phosphatase n=1 Tax=Caulobacter ginsengisoli TaxID=400775 RepID=A0ABU0IN53_9CAUL|nr:alkaline phosphatase PhoX [Caulobacter ginsengisoli]MDQ0462583.1 secreted PhoX family phosphatase [Caulobacter ginsengisoli]